MTVVIIAVILKVAEIVILPYCRNLSGAVIYVKQSTPEKSRKTSWSANWVRIPLVFVGRSQPSSVTAGWASKVATAFQSMKSVRSWEVWSQSFFVGKERDKAVLFFVTVFLFQLWGGKFPMINIRNCGMVSINNCDVFDWRQCVANTLSFMDYMIGTLFNLESNLKKGIGFAHKKAGKEARQGRRKTGILFHFTKPI